MDFINGLITHSSNSIILDKYYLRLKTPRQAKKRYIIINKRDEIDFVFRFEFIILRIRKLCGRIPIVGKYLTYNGKLTARGVYKKVFLNCDPLRQITHQKINRKANSWVEPWITDTVNRVNKMYVAVCKLPDSLSKAFNIRSKTTFSLSMKPLTMNSAVVTNLVDQTLHQYPQFDIRRSDYVENAEQQERIGNIFDKFLEINNQINKAIESININFLFHFTTANTLFFGTTPEIGLYQFSQLLKRIEPPQMHQPKLLRKRYFQLRSTANQNLGKSIKDLFKHLNQLKTDYQEFEKLLSEEKIEKKKIWSLRYQEEMVQRVLKVVKNELQDATAIVVM